MGTNSKLRIASGKRLNNIYRISPWNQSQITVLGCGNAANVIVNPLVVLPGGNRMPKFNSPDDFTFRLGRDSQWVDIICRILWVVGERVL